MNVSRVMVCFGLLLSIGHACFGQTSGTPGAFLISQNTLPAGLTGSVYSTTLTTQPTSSKTVWSVIAGALPDGLSLNAATGQIAGVPLTAGSATFTVQAISSQSLAASRSLTIAVAGLPSFTEYAVGASPGPMTLGPDGAVWLTEGGAQPSIARVDSSGRVSQFPLTQLSGVATFGSTSFGDITTGPDGSLWFTCWQSAASYIGRVSVTGTGTLFATTTYSSLQAITAGADGALWFTEGSANQIGRISIGGSVSEFQVPTHVSGPFGITLGPDGALWFTESNASQVGRISTAGAITEFSLSSQYPGSAALTPTSIVTGPDGALWFTITHPTLIGRLTTGGTFSHFAAPANSLPSGITNGPDGELWFLDALNNQIDSMTTGGAITQHTVPTTGSLPAALIVGGSGDLWFSEQQTGKVAHLLIETTFREYPTLTRYSKPGPIAIGPDSNLWFAEEKTILQIGRVTTTGTLTEYPVPNNAGGATPGNQVGGLTAGPDGNLWYTVSNQSGNSFIGSLTGSGVGLAAYPSNIPSTLGAITAGPDGALWFTAGSANSIGRMTTDGSETDFLLPTPGGNPYGIAVGADGALWFTETAVNKIGRITVDGSVTEYALPVGMQGPLNILRGTASELYFTLSDGGIGQITTSGAISSFPALTAVSIFGMAVGPDGSVWFTDPVHNQLRRLNDTAGYTIPTGSSLPYYLAAGPDGALWFTESGTSKIGRLGIPVIAAATLPIGTIGRTYTASESAAGGTGPYSWSIASGSLPGGLSLDQASGEISGTPSAPGSFAFKVAVTDASQPQAVSSTQLQTIAVQGQVSVPPATLIIGTIAVANGIVGSAYQFSFAAQGGTAPYVWTAASLPSGISLSAAGILSGTPTQAGTYSIVVQVSDSGLPNQTTTQTFSLVIGQSTTAVTTPSALTISTALVPPGAVGIAYATNLAAGGGTKPYVWSATSLPSNLMLSTTGFLSGAPLSPGSYTFAVEVTDSSLPALTATHSYTLAIYPPASSGSSAALSVVGLPATGQPQQAISIGLQLGQAQTSDVAGTATLLFTPGAQNLPTPYINPGVCFAVLSSCAAAPRLTSTFTIPAGATVVSLPQILTGTVEGEISLNVTASNATPVSATTLIPASVPVIEANSVQITNVTTTGFVLELVGDSTPRDLGSATFTFSAATGTQLTGPTTFTIDLSSLLTQWYGSSEGQSYGSLFSLSVPFTLSGSTSALGSVSVTLTNSVGTSAAVSGSQ